MTNQTNQPPREMWDTPEGKAYLSATLTRLLNTLHAPEADPVEKMGAWTDYRAARLTRTGLERLTGPDATYHLIWDFGGYIPAMARKLSHCGKKCSKGTMKAVVSDVLWTTQKMMGYRWRPGYHGLLGSLEAHGISPERCIMCAAERDAFKERYGRLSRTIDTLIDEGLTDSAYAATRGLVDALIQETEQLASWLEMAGKWGEAKDLKIYAEEAQEEMLGSSDRS